MRASIATRASIVGLIAATMLAFGVTAAQAAPPSNDNFSGTAISGSLNGSVVGSTVEATGQTDEPCHNDCDLQSVWYSWTAPATGVTTFTTSGSTFNPVMAMYTGAALASLTWRAFNDDLSDVSTESRIQRPVTGGLTYRIVIDGFNSDSGSFTLNWSTVVAPANDAFPGSSIGTSTGSVNGTTVAASGQAGESCHWDCALHSVWYSWTAPGTGTATFTTSASGFDPTLTAYTGTAIDNLTWLAQNNDATGSTTESTIIINAVGGSSYRIVIDGFDDATGAFTLGWSQVLAAANDSFGTAVALSGYYGNLNGTTLAATGEPGEPCHLDCTLRSVWYRWTAPVTGAVKIRTTASNYNPAIAVYTGSAVNSLTTIGYNDDASTSTIHALVAFGAIKGTVYRIVVDGFEDNAGTFTLAWSYNYRPDGHVKYTSDSRYLGNNIYNLTTIGQARSVNAKRSTSKTFYVRIQNDGTATDSFKVKGAGSSTGFTVRYYNGSTNITSAVVGGTYTLSSVAVGAIRTLRIVITVASNTSYGAAKAATVTTWSTHGSVLKDVVKAAVKVVS